MSVPYPHSVTVERPGAPSTEDAWGRDVPGAATSVGTLTAWVQAKSAEEQTLLTERGAVRSDHTVFLYPAGVAVDEGDTLVTVAGGGQASGVRHQIVAIRDPDGTGHHLEVDTIVVEPID